MTRIIGLSVENYRSIEKLKLNNLGNINIFVGKNNSGKSTILKSIETVIKIMNKQLIVRMFDKKDFHSNQINLPIKIASSFLLEDSVFEELLRKMREEYPQLLSGVDGFVNLRSLNVYTASTNYSDDNKVYSYIEKITLSESSPFSSDTINETSLFNIEIRVVRELISRMLKLEDISRKLKQLDEMLDTINTDDYTRYKERGVLSRVRNNEVLVDLINSTNNYHEFRNHLREEIENHNLEITRISNQETEREFQVFSGTTKIVPSHIQWLMGILERTKLLQESERKSPIEKKDAERLLDLKVTRGADDRLAQLQDTVLNLLGVRVDAFKGTSSLASAEMDVGNFLVDMNGTGIRESLRLILDFEFTNPEIVLIEEPEVHLHFELERKMFKYLLQMSNNTQIFMTTHSTGFIDSSEMNNIFLVKKGTSTEVSTIKNNGLMEVIGELGINISSLLLSKVIVFVEGPTDEQIVRAYLDKFHPYMTYSDVGIIRMTGVGNYKYYANAHALEVFNNYGLKTFFILDSDSRSEEEIKRITDNHPKTSMIKILSKRCIENYFLTPTILLKFIQLKMSISGLKKGGSIEIELINLEKRMSEIIDSLYPETLRLYLSWKYLKPIYPTMHFNKETQFGSVEEVKTWLLDGVKKVEDTININYSEFESKLPLEFEQLSNKWNERKLDIVPGDKVIDTLCSDFGIRYNKSKNDIELLSQVISADEWPPELITILKEIAQLVAR